MQPARAGPCSLGSSRSRARVAVLVRAQQPQRPPQLGRPSVPPPPPPPRPSGYSEPQFQQYDGQGLGGPQQAPPGNAYTGGPPQDPNNKPGSGPSQPLGGFVQALVAAAFVMGLGLGTWFDSEVVLTPANISSTEIIDRAVPNADICMANGYSASVLSMNVFVTYNPFNVYISQPQVKGGCVLRRANVGLLEREKLVTPKDVDLCKQRMNTFAYVGDLKSEPEVACVYHSEEAENQYLEVLGNRAKMSELLMQGGSKAAATPAATPSS
ncbi:hypothetical protein HYH03_006343 [Edaphochlamys debaryana]|uniref:DUF3172 domain-containing protein n=1 Tax=Edaphochlamys debaryana TaxID=47281 RepID=A0A836C0E5_9CHLO|nr:hypothetical protein HYH03_006343 [Edaphochlamys debaryana]|eukprot:KAG2495746.1 hypothetical protein HYH03_006343 [Edaphochlamys debaryana]